VGPGDGRSSSFTGSAGRPPTQIEIVLVSPVDRWSFVCVDMTTRIGRPTVGWASLTQTEQVVVELLLGGRTNRMIGDHLGISRRTVETHLSHVFGKLNLRTRVELAAEAARRAAPQPSAQTGVCPTCHRAA
jgi:DNA-binding CsgD family transcriptional regulator